jgi:hypothetical protein
MGRLDIIRFKEKVDMMLAKIVTPYSGKWNNTDPKFMIQWAKREGDKSMSKNKYCLLLLL